MSVNPETAEQNPSLDAAELEWDALWNPLPKVVFSHTLPTVRANARLASGGLAEEIERLWTQQGTGDIAIGGATLAAEAASEDLIDEYRARIYPVLVGGGIPFFPRRERRVDLELVETRTFTSGILHMRYRVGHAAAHRTVMACHGRRPPPRPECPRPQRPLARGCEEVRHQVVTTDPVPRQTIPNNRWPSSISRRRSRSATRTA